MQNKLTEPKLNHDLIHIREVHGDEKRIFNVELGDKSSSLANEDLKTMKSSINNVRDVREFSEVDLETIRKVIKEELSIKLDVFNLCVTVTLYLNDKEISTDSINI
jgi:hypothetical protein